MSADPALGAVCAGVALVLATSALAFLYFAARGLGHAASPFPRKEFPASNALGFVSTMLTALVYMAKALEFLDPQHGRTFVGGIEYWDYAFTCSLIMADYCITLGLQMWLVYALSTFLLLCMGALSYATSGWVSATYFVLGTLLFSAFFCILLRDARAAIFTQLPPGAVPSARMATGVLVVFWPLFPALWLLGRKGLGVVDGQLGVVLHGVLDMVCKTVFGIVLTECRLCIEDFLLDEAQRLSGTAAAAAAAAEEEEDEHVTPQAQAQPRGGSVKLLQYHGAKRPSLLQQRTLAGSCWSLLEVASSPSQQPMWAEPVGGASPRGAGRGRSRGGAAGAGDAGDAGGAGGAGGAGSSAKVVPYTDS